MAQRITNKVPECHQKKSLSRTMEKGSEVIPIIPIVKCLPKIGIEMQKIQLEKHWNNTKNKIGCMEYLYELRNT